MADKGPAAKGGCRGRQHKHPDVELTTGDKVIGPFLGPQVTGNADGNAITPVKENKKEQPVYMSSHVLLLSLINRQLAIHFQNDCFLDGTTSFCIKVKQLV